MAFGLCNAPAIFERPLDNVLGGVRCLLYIDVIIVHTITFELELQRWRLVFSRFRAANLKLNPKKCKVLKVAWSCSLWGRGLPLTQILIEAVKNWPVVRNTKKVRKFVGLCAFYQRFIRSFSDRRLVSNNLFYWIQMSVTLAEGQVHNGEEQVIVF